MKNTPQTHRQIRLERLYEAHAAVEKATRKSLQSQADQADAFERACIETENARSTVYATVKMTTAEAHALLSLALPRSARTIPLRREHALLMIAIGQVLDELAAISTGEVPYTAICAAQHLAVQVRDWLVINNHVVMQRGDRMTDPMIGRPRSPDAQNRLPRGRPPLGSPFSSWHNCHSPQAGATDLALFRKEKASG